MINGLNLSKFYWDLDIFFLNTRQFYTHLFMKWFATQTRSGFGQRVKLFVIMWICAAVYHTLTYIVYWGATSLNYLVEKEYIAFHVSFWIVLHLLCSLGYMYFDELRFCSPICISRVDILSSFSVCISKEYHILYTNVWVIFLRSVK